MDVVGNFPNTSATASYQYALTREEYLILYVPTDLLMLVGLVGNITVIAAIASGGRKFHTAGYALLTSLSVVESCAASSSVAIDAVNLAYRYGQHLPPLLLRALGHFAKGIGQVHMAHLLCIAVNRFCGVVAYQKYPALFTKYRTGSIIAGCWMYGVVLGVVVTAKYEPLVMRAVADDTASNGIVEMGITVVGSLAVIAMCYLYTHMMCRIKSNKVGQQDNSSTDREKRKRREETNLMIQFSLISLAYILAVTFTVIAWFVTTPSLQKPVNIIFLTLWAINFTINPFIYFIFNQTLRKACIKMCCFSRTTNDQAPTTGTTHAT